MTKTMKSPFCTLLACLISLTVVRCENNTWAKTGQTGATPPMLVLAGAFGEQNSYFSVQGTNELSTSLPDKVTINRTLTTQNDFSQLKTATPTAGYSFRTTWAVGCRNEDLQLLPIENGTSISDIRTLTLQEAASSHTDRLVLCSDQNVPLTFFSLKARQVVLINAHVVIDERAQMFSMKAQSVKLFGDSTIDVLGTQRASGAIVAASIHLDAASFDASPTLASSSNVGGHLSLTYSLVKPKNAAQIGAQKSDR